MGTAIWPLAAFIGIAALIIWLQLWLSSRKSFVPGLLLVVPTCVLFLTLTVWAFYTNAGYHDVVLSENLKNETTAEVTVRLDRDNQVVAVTELLVKDKEGNLLEKVGIDGEGYPKTWAKITEGYDINADTAPIFDHDMEYGVYLFHGGMIISKTAFLGFILFLDLPLLIIYLFKRFQIRKKRRIAELKKMNIESL